jgi:predicted Zn-dependent protease
VLICVAFLRFRRLSGRNPIRKAWPILAVQTTDPEPTMNARRLAAALACIAALSACASAPTSTLPEKLPLVTALNNADTALKAGQNNAAAAILQDAARDYPDEKMPWLRLAQMRFETKNYGEAIVAALEVLQRDGDDTLAHSIVAVSGLRLASKALADLTQKNNMTGNIKDEAQDLTKLLRDTLGEEKLIPAASKAPLQR